MAPNSPVQDRALEILDLIDLFDREKARADRVRELVATGEFDQVKAYFPEYFGTDPYEEARDPDTGEIDIDKIDDSRLEWGVPTEDEDEELERWIREREAGTFTAEEISDEWL